MRLPARANGLRRLCRVGEALNELQELAYAERRPDPPPWAATWRAQDDQIGHQLRPAGQAPWEKHLVAVKWADSYLVIDDELCLSVIEGRVVTVLTKALHVSPPSPGSPRSLLFRPPDSSSDHRL